MKLIIQIPCYNEADTLAIALAALPRQVPGFNIVEWLIIDDGCVDDTVRVAKECGVDHIINFTKNQGLAKGFMAGIKRALAEGADVIVNTDADNQYCAADIPTLVQPILDGKADYVVGARPIATISHFSPVKKLLQKLGSCVVRLASNTDIPDAPSGFRAMTRECAMQLNVFNEYTYTLETIIQAGQKGMAIASVPVRVNDDLRPSRLVKNIPSYIKKSIITIIRIFVIYRPFRFFASIAFVSILLGVLLGIRYLWFLWYDPATGHVQSLILATILSITGINALLTAFLADLLGANRKLLEEIQFISKNTLSSDFKKDPTRG